MLRVIRAVPSDSPGPSPGAPFLLPQPIVPPKHLGSEALQDAFDIVAIYKEKMSKHVDSPVDKYVILKWVDAFQEQQKMELELQMVRVLAERSG
jgi:hypothetical protein